MAIEPKTPRKRAVKKASAKAEASVTEVITDEPKKATRKKAAIPVPIFQAAPDKPVAKAVRKKAEVDKLQQQMHRRKIAPIVLIATAAAVVVAVVAANQGQMLQRMKI